eukprot:8333367-Lingulodinium_polyedra.AAC.1
MALARLGVDKAALVDGISLLKKLSWSQVSTEQGHKPGSVVSKAHRHGQHMLGVRSMMGQA